MNEHDVLGDHRGKLIALEGNKDIPFNIKRAFYIYDTKLAISRGNHSHYKTRQYLVSVSGACKVTLDDGKGNKKTYVLNSPNKGLFQDALIWGTMHDFTDDNVLLVFADQHFYLDDYITDYQEFLKVVNEEH